MTQQQKDHLIARVRNAATVLLECPDLNEEYVAIDGGNSLTDADYTGVNEGIPHADFVAFFSNIVPNILAVTNDAGKRTALYKLAKP